jgi:hypothetical protein
VEFSPYSIYKKSFMPPSLFFGATGLETTSILLKLR